MSDPKVIYLEPECCADPIMGRMWCASDWPYDCEDGKTWTKYILADLGAEKDRHLKELAEALKVLNNYKGLDDFPFWEDGIEIEDCREIRAAIKLAQQLTEGK